MGVAAYEAGSLTWQDDFTFGAGPVGLNLSFPVNGGAVGAFAGDVTQEGPWIPAWPGGQGGGQGGGGQVS